MTSNIEGKIEKDRMTVQICVLSLFKYLNSILCINIKKMN